MEEEIRFKTFGEVVQEWEHNSIIHNNNNNHNNKIKINKYQDSDHLLDQELELVEIEKLHLIHFRNNQKIDFIFNNE
jgi:hypothetical protein